MKNSRHLNKILIALVLLAHPRAGLAYLDLGTGSYVLQLLIAGILGASFAVKMSWGKIKGLWASLFCKSSKDRKDDE